MEQFTKEEKMRMLDNLIADDLITANTWLKLSVMLNFFTTGALIIIGLGVLLANGYIVTGHCP